MFGAGCLIQRKESMYFCKPTYISLTNSWIYLGSTLHLGLTPCGGGGACVSTQRAVPAGTLVPCRSNFAGLIEG